MHLAPPPEPRELLPPLLACLPTAFVSPRPPPALLPLLSPLLRQRLNFLGIETGTSTTAWLPLLSWNEQRASKVSDIVKDIELEPHPVSGEVEIDDIRSVKYRRLDEETLQSRLDVEQFGLVAVFMWCEDEAEADYVAGWKLNELMGEDDEDEAAGEWFASLVEADEAASAVAGRTLAVPGQNGRKDVEDETEEDDDDYWASYDRTPGCGPTPAKHSPVPPGLATGRADAEQDYYSRYGAEVQPALDAHDPDEEHAEMGESTLNGTTLLQRQQQQQQQEPKPNRPSSRPTGASTFPLDTQNARLTTAIEQPRPISPAESQSSIEKLEQKAAVMEESADRAQTAIKQHISTDVKSLFRLARNTGMERTEFERIVKTELDCLGFMEEGE